MTIVFAQMAVVLATFAPGGGHLPDSTRVAELQFGPSRVVLEAHSSGSVTVSAQTDRLTGATMVTLSELRGWLDSATVLTSVRDRVKRGYEINYLLNTPGGALQLIRTADRLTDTYLFTVGLFVKATVTIQHQELYQLLESLAAAARQADRMNRLATLKAARAAGQAGGPDSGRAIPDCRLTVAVSAATPLAPPDSAAIFLDRVRGELESRLETYAGLPSDAGLGVSFLVRADGAGWNPAADSSGSRAVADLREVVRQAGVSYRFTGLPHGYPQVRLRALLQPRCPR